MGQGGVMNGRSLESVLGCYPQWWLKAALGQGLQVQVGSLEEGLADNLTQLSDLASVEASVERSEGGVPVVVVPVLLVPQM